MAKPKGIKIDIPKEKLIELYVEKKMKKNDIAELFGVSRQTILRRLEEYGIPLVKEKYTLKNKKEPVSKEDFVKDYIENNLSMDEMMKKYNISKSKLIRLIRLYDAHKSKELEVKCRQRLNMQRYGVKEKLSLKEVRDKIKKTNLEKYGVENVFAAKEIKDKVKKTNLEKYGVENVWSSGSPILRVVKKTNIEKYGTENPYSSEKIKEKIKTTNNKKYGVDWYCTTEHAKNNNKQYKISKANKKFGDKLKSVGIDYSLEYYIDNYSYDIKVGDTLIEINPSYTHNSTKDAVLTHTTLKAKPYDYHLYKTKLAEEHGFRCIHIFDWDDEDKVINMLLPKEPIYARKCIIKEISNKEANIFLNSYHLQGGLSRQPICLGLYYNGELVELMTFGKPRYNKNYEYELLRLCSHKDYLVIGGTQKLFKCFIECYKPSSIISYCDIAKFTGEVYSKLGFTLKNTSIPARHWYNMKTGQHITDNLLRQRGFDQLFGTNYGKGTSNDELMLKHGFVEIYDCGQSTYIWNLN